MITDVDGVGGLADLGVGTNEGIFYTTFSTRAWEKTMLSRTTESTTSAPSSIETYSPTSDNPGAAPLTYRRVFT